MRRISSSSPYEAKIGYARAIVAGGFVHVSGTTGLVDGQSDAGDVTEQCRIALSRISSALAEAGAGFEHVVRVTYILPDRNDFPLCWPQLREAFGPNPPAATMLQAGLIDEKMKIEISVTAIDPTTP